MIKIKTILICILMLVMMTSPVIAQTDSLIVWENIADGTLINTWIETDDEEWKGQNETDIWSYNFTSDSIGVAVNATNVGSRTFQTYEATSTDAEAGIMLVQTMDITAPTTNFYSLIYYLDGPVGATPEAYIAYYDAGIPGYWNGTGFEANINNATNYASQEDEFDYYSGFIRVKALWNWKKDDGTFNCTARFKIWDPTGDEPIDWLIDEAFPFYPGDEYDSYYSGIGADHTISGEATTLFRSIMFWNLSFDYSDDLLQIPTINCPTVSALTFATYIFSYFDEDSVWNSTQLLKDFINLFDLISIYTDDQYDGITDQNDSIYHFTIMITDVREFLQYFFDIEPTEDIPDNILFMETYLCPDGSSNESDWMLLRIDTDNNDVYDIYDYAFWTSDTTFIAYQGNISFGNESYQFGDMYSGSSLGFPLGEVFRDDAYYCYNLFLNWDMIYNGSSGERIGTDTCRYSISWWNEDQNNLTILADFDEEDDTEMLSPPSEEFDWENYNDTEFWVYFHVDESISGEEMEDPEESDITDESQLAALVGSIQTLMMMIAQLVIVLALIGLVSRFISKWNK